MAYYVGASSGSLVTAVSFFGIDPRSVYIPGERVNTHALTTVQRGYPRSVWSFTWMELATYRQALGVLLGTAGTGTVSGTIALTALTGVSTAFDTQLAVSDILAIHIGSGIYEISTVASITDDDELTVSSAFTQTFATKSFLYRRYTTYSGQCYLTTRDDLDYWRTYRAIATFPDAGRLERSGGKYLNVEINFTLLEVVA